MGCFPHADTAGDTLRSSGNSLIWNIVVEMNLLLSTEESEDTVR